MQARAGSPFCGVLDAPGPPCLTANVRHCFSNHMSAVRRTAGSFLRMIPGNRRSARTLRWSFPALILVLAAAGCTDRQQQRKAEGYETFAFLNICEVLGLDSEQVRGRLRTLTPHDIQNVGRPPTRRRLPPSSGDSDYTDTITFDWQDAYITDTSGTILTTLYAAYSLWLVKRHNSTRAGAMGLLLRLLGCDLSFLHQLLQPLVRRFLYHGFRLISERRIVHDDLLHGDGNLSLAHTHTHSSPSVFIRRRHPPVDLSARRRPACPVWRRIRSLRRVSALRGPDASWRRPFPGFPRVLRRLIDAPRDRQRHRNGSYKPR